MNNQVRNISLLKKVLWADFILGSGTAVIGLLWHKPLTGFLGLPENLIVIVAAITLLYALVAISLTLQSSPSFLWLRILIYANWVWTVISVFLLIAYANGATIFGIIFLILQVIVVGVLAWLEGKHINQPLTISNR